MGRFSIAAIGLLVVLATGQARTEPLIDFDSASIRFSGYMALETGEIMSGRFKQYLVDHRWRGRTIGNLTAEAQLGPRSKVLLTMEGKWWIGDFPAEYATNKEYGLQNYADFYLYQAQGIFSIVNNGRMSLDFSFGIIPYKYNPEARNLGEYLFRSLCYPGIVMNDFDFALDRLTGLRLNFSHQNSIGELTADAFVLSERTFRPLGDISLAAVASYKFFKAIDIGVGVNLYRALSVNSRFTTPHLGNATLYDVSGPQYDSTGYVTGYKDSSFYTFAGTKLMARATLDPLFFLRDTRVGKVLGEGGKVYGEIDILGLKSYPANDTSRKQPDGTPFNGLNPYGYDTLLNKMPITVGVNIPVPWLLDICAVELEYYQMRYPNSYRNVFVDGRPIPSAPYLDPATSDLISKQAYSVNDNWKWSVYIKKNITRHVNIVAQAARDHQRWMVPSAQWGQISDWDDIALLSDNWIWTLKTAIVF